MEKFRSVGRNEPVLERQDIVAFLKNSLAGYVDEQAQFPSSTGRPSAKQSILLNCLMLGAFPNFMGS